MIQTNQLLSGRTLRYDRAGELVDQLKLEISELMARAEAADGGADDDPQALPREIARREALRDRLDAARRRLEAKARAEAERAEYEAKVAARDARTGRAKGKHPKPPDGTPRPDEQSKPAERPGQPADAQEQVSRIPPSL